MRVRRGRMTVRKLVIAVAIIGILVGMAKLWWTHLLYAERAANHAALRSFYLQSPASVEYWEQRWTGQREGLKGSFLWPDGPPFVPAIAAYHERMRAKWERASWMPWLSVEPDPIK
jgi:hypothetical protein